MSIINIRVAVATIGLFRTSSIAATAAYVILNNLTPCSATGLTGLTLQAGLPTFIAAAILENFA